ncbi:hypothetical protein [Streptomyces sp. NPDC091287]|uniref:hypothetical protein n=1 Tax=Streptomyces sp. NPDC091287 TaxID=3365988 RepID=UPI00381550C8
MATTLEHRTLHGSLADGVPAWARRVAFLIPFTVLPSGLWRIAGMTFGLPVTKDIDVGRGEVPGWLPMEVYAVVLTLFAEAVAFLAIGLVSTWGEVWPRWMPFVGGRPVRPMAAIVPAALGALVLTALWTTAFVAILSGHGADGSQLGDGTLRGMLLHLVGALDWRAVLFLATYVPLIAWGPLLAAVTYAYAVRRNVLPRRKAV